METTMLTSAVSNSEVVGAGGFGVVVVDPEDQNRVIKLMRPHVRHLEAEREYEAHAGIHRKLQQVLADHPELKDKIAVPEPYGFDICSDTMRQKCANYNCSITMDRVTSSRPDGVQEHVILNDMYDGQVGYIHLAQQTADKLPVSTNLTDAQKAFGPRGAFLGPSQLRALNLEETARCLGMLHGIVYAAGYKPKDVEIVLDKSKRLVMYDFGMVCDDYNDFDRTLDMYVPSAEDNTELFDAFLAGVHCTKGL